MYNTRRGGCQDCDSTWTWSFGCRHWHRASSKQSADVCIGCGPATPQNHGALGHNARAEQGMIKVFCAQMARKSTPARVLQARKRRTAAGAVAGGCGHLTACTLC